MIDTLMGKDAWHTVTVSSALRASDGSMVIILALAKDDQEVFVKLEVDKARTVATWLARMANEAEQANQHKEVN